MFDWLNLLKRLMATLRKWVSFKEESTVKLTSPTLNDITVVSDTELKATWNAITGADSYKVQWSADTIFGGGSDLGQEGEAIVTDQEFTLDNLNPGETRYFRVFALAKNYQDSGASNVKSGQTSSSSSFYLESECGSVGSDWTIYDASNTGGSSDHTTASNVAYVKPDTTSQTNPQGTQVSEVNYFFTVNDPGLYRFWIRKIIPDQANDSVWFSVNGGTTYLSNNMGTASAWNWNFLRDSDNGGQVIEANLPLGANYITLGLRDSGIKIDKVYVTKNADTPTGSGAAAVNCVIPDDPVISLGANSTTEVQIAVSQSSFNTNSVQIQRDTDPGFGTPTEVQDTYLFSLVDSGLTANTLYYYRARLRNYTGDSNWVSGSVTTLQATQLTAPVITSAVFVSGSGIQIYWDSVAGADDYTIEYDDEDTFTGATSDTGSSPYILSSVNPGDTFYFRVKATGAGFIDSPWSATAIVTVPGTQGQLSTPTGFNATSPTSTTIALDWDAVTNATSYTYEYATNPSFTSPTTVSGVTATNDTITGLTASTQYYIRIKAVDGTATYTDSEWVSTSATTTGAGPGGNIYYASPNGINTNLATNSRTNPADGKFFMNGSGAALLQPGDQVYYRTDLGSYNWEGGVRIQAVGTAADPIIYRAEPGGGLVHVKITRYPNSDWNSLDRYINHNGISIGGEWYWTNQQQGTWNSRLPEDSLPGRYCYVMDFITEGQYKQVTGTEKARDFSQISTPYGNTGSRAAGTVTGTVDGGYDFFTGGMSIRALGGKFISCICWHVGQAGVFGASSSIFSTDVETHLCGAIGTGHSGNDGRDHGHNRYLQHRSDATGYFICEGDWVIASAEEQMQIWTQTDTDSQGYSKTDKFRLIDITAINGGGLSGQAYPNTYKRNLLLGGYSNYNDNQIIGFMSYNNPDKSGGHVYLGYSLNFPNEPRQVIIKDCYIASPAIGHLTLYNVNDVSDISGNTFVNNRSPQNALTMMVYDVMDYNQTEFEASLGNFQNNKYFRGVNLNELIRYRRWQGPPPYTKIFDTAYTLASWQSTYSSESGSTVTLGTPSNYEKVVRNKFMYLNPNFVLTKTIFNWDNNTTASVRVTSSDMSVGQKYRIIDCQNMAPDGISNFLAEYTFVGPTSETRTFTIPDTGSPVAEDPTGEMINFEHTPRQLCFIAVIKVR